MDYKVLITSLVSIVIGASILVLTYMPLLNVAEQFPTSTDFYKFHLSAKNVVFDNQNPYWSAPKRNPDLAHCHNENLLDISERRAIKQDSSIPFAERQCLHPNLNPPFFIVLTSPLAFLDYSAAWWLWNILSFLSAAISIALLIRSGLFRNTRLARPWPIILLLLLLLYYPTVASVQLGQVTLLLMLPLTLAWLNLRQGNDIKAGLWLGLIAGLKPFIGLFLIGLLISRRYKAVAAWMSALAATGLIGLVFLGIQAYIDYLGALSNVYWHASSWNASIQGFFYRIFGGSGNPSLFDMPNLAVAQISIFSLLVIFLYAACIHTSKAAGKALPGKDSADIIFSITVPAMLLLSPLGWMYYFPLLLLSVSILWVAAEMYSNPRLVRLLIVFAILLSATPSALIPMKMLDNPKAWFVDAGVYFYSVAMLFALSVAGSIKQTRVSNHINREAFTPEIALAQPSPGDAA